jgi:thiamine transporter
MDKRNVKLVTLVEGAVVAAVAMALSFIPAEGPNAAFDLSIGLIPLAIYAVRRGTLPAVAVGAVWGLLHLLVGKAYILSIPQFIFEYPFAFAFGGLFGLFAKQIRSSLFASERSALAPEGPPTNAGRPRATESRTGNTLVLWIVLASVACAISRWFWHFIAGGIVWAEYAPPEMNPWIYSLIMNGASCIANAVMLIIVMLALTKAAPRLFHIQS